MSTVVVVRKGSSVAIAVDSLTTTNYKKMDTRYSDSLKIQKVGENYIGTVGSPAHQLVLHSVFQAAKEPPRFRNTMEIFEYFRKLHNRLINDYHILARDEKGDAYESSQIVALIANPHGIFRMTALREVHEHKKFWAIGSGDDLAIGAMFAVYDSELTARQIAEMGVRTGIEFDPSSAGPLVSYTIDLAHTEPPQRSRNRASKPSD